MQESTRRKPRPAALVLGVGLAWALVYIVCLAVVKEADVPKWLGIVLALAPIVPFLAFLRVLGRISRDADELHQRVQLEALGFAYPAMMVLLMTLGLLELVVPLSAEDFSMRHLWGYMPMLYLLGLVLSWRRYK